MQCAHKMQSFQISKLVAHTVRNVR